MKTQVDFFFKANKLSGCELNNCEFIIIKAMPPSIKFVFRTQLIDVKVMN